MHEIYLFSGLGADERLFRFLDFSGYKVHFIKWIKPDGNESIENYAQRLSQQIITKNPVLIGMSFGGMIAIEVAKFMETHKIILISSFKTKKEIPFYLKMIGYLRLYKIFPYKFLKHPNSLTNWIFGTSNESDKRMLADILNDTDPLFLKWALYKIFTWKNSTVPKNLQHIHGASDRLLPSFFVSYKTEIKGGSHLMILNKADEVSEKIRELLV